MADPLDLAVDQPPRDPSLNGTAEPATAAAKKKPDRKPNTGQRRRSAGRPTKVETTEAELRRQLEDAFASLGMTIMAVAPDAAWEADGKAIIDRADKLADALVILSRQNEAVRRILSGGLTGSAWFGVLGTFGGLAFTIAKNHGALGPGLSGLPAGMAAPSPEAMAAMMADLTPEEQAVMAKITGKMMGGPAVPGDAPAT